MVGAMSCDGCTRRMLLQTLALGTAGALVGCGNDHGFPDAMSVDTPDASEMPVTMCGDNLCIDISKLATLQNVNGQMVVPVTKPKTDRILVLRTDDTTFATLSAICTHAGCTVGYAAGNMRLNCPCHGSQFSLTGAVLRSPAQRPLKVYTNMFDTQTQILTITLA